MTTPTPSDPVEPIASKDPLKPISGRDLRHLETELDKKEDAREREFIEMSRPVLFGKTNVNWDGAVLWVSNFWDNLIWKLYGADVLASQQKDKPKNDKTYGQSARSKDARTQKSDPDKES